MNYVSWKERKKVVADLKPIYRAATAEAAAAALGESALAEFRQTWPKLKVIADLWERNWERVIPFFQFPPEIRKVIYTTNAVESLHMSLRKVTKNRGSFPTEEAAFKLLYLVLRNAAKNWSTVQFWKEAMAQFEMIYPGRRRPSSGKSKTKTTNPRELVYTKLLTPRRPQPRQFVKSLKPNSKTIVKNSSP